MIQVPAAAPLPSDASAPGSISATAEVERAHKDPVIDSIIATCKSIDALCDEIQADLRNPIEARHG
jgi:hypothetical protein